ncbi:hypothetical protein AB0E00_20765 [Streptomyces sp. NPDC048110]|uniref:hypothetical protein n=1 Tax=Streptomyces sp. NPDC048110 TaxID=3155483 RepID=UPI0034118E29
MGDNPAAVRWDFNAWPEAPEVGLGGGTRGAFVTLCANARDLDLEEAAADYTVFVHVKQVEGERAQWLAAQGGLRRYLITTSRLLPKAPEQCKQQVGKGSLFDFVSWV